MGHPRRFRFGVQLSHAPSAEAWAAQARRAEQLGYSSLFLPDHFGDQLAPIPAMMAAADATSELRVGALVFDNDYKHPVVLAKEIATIDVLTGGRVEFGIGAGWMTTDYEQAGIPKERDGVRISRMAEGLEVCKGLWADGPFSFVGDHYRITGLDGMPKPAQRPHPPILIGGGGPKMLGIAGRHADIVGINPRLHTGRIDAETARDALARVVDEKVGWLRDAAGSRFDDLELNILVFACVVTDDRAGVLDGMAKMFAVDPSEADDIPYAWVGTVDEICAQLQAARERWGTSYFVVQGEAGMEGAAPIVARLSGS